MDFYLWDVFYNFSNLLTHLILILGFGILLDFMWSAVFYGALFLDALLHF